MSIYAISGIALRKDVVTDVTTFNVYPFSAKANDIAQAEAEGMKHLLEYCPPTEGWHTHSCRAIEVPGAWYQKETP